MKCRNCKNNTLLDDGEQFNWCEIRHDNLDIDEERYCEAFSQATNGDKIRAMTDEKLAEFHERQTVFESCWNCPATEICAANNDSSLETLCKDSYLIWLKQECKE